jgi:hypothetical protein
MPTTLFMHGAAPYGDLQRAGIIIRKFNDAAKMIESEREQCG